ncbi:MAG: EAL domain-containing protein [Lachnospiraceae bacterium]|nr:EAL domain-containing protein [Lachnospiraceae bacterium]
MGELNRDYLTGLYNRQELNDYYNSISVDSKFHIMFMDVDNFKAVNDIYGHHKGDDVLKCIANILKSSAPMAHIIRLGGDEFCLLFVGEYLRQDLCEIAEKIITRVTQKEGFSKISTYISSSIGILYDETKASTLDDILQKSDVAMYYAKSHGKGKFIVFNDIEKKIRVDMEMEQRQQYALDNNEFEVRYYPVLNTQTSKLKYSRARLYWNMPDGTVWAQEDFLPLFRKNGFVSHLVAWVVPQVLKHLALYHESTGCKGKVGVRISRLLLLDEEFPDRLEALVNEYAVSPEEIDLEIDESSFAHIELRVIQALEKLKEKGFSISIVGVGSDFKSITFWDKFHFDSITFDAQYLRNALDNPRGRMVIKVLLALGRELKMSVIADGIETKEDAMFLGRCGCNAISGPFCSDPLPLKQYHDYVKDKIIYGEDKTEFMFQNNLCSADGSFEGKILGSNVEYVKGISNRWGGLRFHGGDINENVVELPAEILGEDSYTICMWMKPKEEISWTSVFYARYRGSFCAFSPFVVGGNSVFRVSEDAEFSGFHDALTRYIPKDKWCFVSLTYDEIAGIIRTYINGRKACYAEGIPVLAACRQILVGGDPFQPTYQGDVSGLIFYGHVKSEEEIAEIYNGFCEEKGFCGKKEDFWME